MAFPFASMILTLLETQSRLRTLREFARLPDYLLEDIGTRRDRLTLRETEHLFGRERPEVSTPPARDHAERLTAPSPEPCC